MKKWALAFLSACMIFSASSAVSAAVPTAEKKHEQKMHHKKVHEKKMHAKSHAKKAHKLHARSHHAKSLRAKDISQMPRTGFGGASEQTE